MRKRYAANRVEVDRRILDQAIVEIENGQVVDYYTFSTEQAHTKWLGGTITVKTENNERHAFWHHQQL
jgi:hypothetical protein